MFGDTTIIKFFSAKDFTDFRMLAQNNPEKNARLQHQSLYIKLKMPAQATILFFAIGFGLVYDNNGRRARG